MSLRLAPRQIAQNLCTFVPDRDERASQIVVETLLTLSQNDYIASSIPADALRSPKVRRFALRSLVMGRNFLRGRGSPAKDGSEGTRTRAELGALLEAGQDFDTSENLSLVVDALRGLIDRTTTGSQSGARLMFPFHEKLLWYDARDSTRNGWDVRKVNMRGTGITMARLLCDAAVGSDSERAASLGVELRAALQSDNSVARIANAIERLDGSDDESEVQPDERDAWDLASDPSLVELCKRLRRFVLGALSAKSVAYSARLWAMRNIVALEIATHILRRSYSAYDVDGDRQYLLISVGGPDRPENFTRQVSEAALEGARRTIREALITTILEEITSLDENGLVDWLPEFVDRRNDSQSTSKLDEIAARLPGRVGTERQDLAREIFTTGTYERTEEAFRRLLDSIGVLGGSGQYRFIEGTPDLFSAFVYALSDKMPMKSHEFFRAIYEEWQFIVGPDCVSLTDLGTKIDASELARNSRRVEQMLVDCGLAQSFSDSTTVIGAKIAYARGL